MASLRLLLALTLTVVLFALPQSASAIVGGELHADPTSPYVFVGQMAGPRNACTGVAIGPRLVVTAAHCGLLENGTAPAGQLFAVRQGDNFRAPRTASGGIFVPHPGFSLGGDGLPHFASMDLAVIQVMGPPLSGPFAKLPDLGMTESLKGGTKLDIYGFGVSEMHGNTPIPESFDGFRRHDDAKLLGGNAIGDQFLHFNGGACLGDSGGPVVYDGTVIGVISFAPSGCKSTNYATRLDTAAALSFINGFPRG
jgi:hypothetical protein